MSRCTVLGAIRAFDADGRERVLASASQRRLLAVLCLHAGHVTRPAVLEEHLQLSPGALRTSVSRLRRALGADVLQTAAAGYELRASTDVAEFERLVGAAHDAAAEQARPLLERARSLWAGAPYDEFAHEPWAEVEVRRLGEAHAAAMEELALVMLDAEDDAAALAVLLPLVDAHPYRDLPRGLVMRALAESGRTTEALRQFHSYRCLLREDVGAEPSAGLIDLDRAIAGGTDLAVLRARGHPAFSRRGRPLTVAEIPARLTLPTPIGSYVGRVRETAEVARLLADHRIVTLTGPGGSGTSRLALRVASAWSHSGAAAPAAWWIDLDAVAPAGDVAGHIAAEIGFVPGRDPVGELTRRLGDRPALLVLDNAEHVIDGTAAVLADVLSRCPGTRALVTSREPLGVAGEQVWPVPPLGLPDEPTAVTLEDVVHHDAIHLFLTRAREARPGMAIDQRAMTHVVSICVALDGLPLALELAAARLRTLPLPAVASGIGEIMGWTSERGHATVARHATLRASIEWSFGHVSPSEQRTLVVLATFRSPIDAGAAAAVAGAVGGCGSVADHVSRLAEVGLLQLDDDSGRYRVLNTVREFCVERSAEWGTLAAAEAAHARFFADWCVDVGAGRLGLEHRPFVRRMPDVVAAMAWAREHDPRVVFRICRGLAPVRSTLGHYAEFDATWQWLTSFPVDRRDRDWAEAVSGLLATATALVLDTTEAVAAVCAAIGDEPGPAQRWLERSRAMVPAYGGRTTRIVAYVDGLLERGDDLEASVYVGFAAYMLALMGRGDECDRLLDELRRLTRRHDAVFSVDSVGNGYAAAVVADALRGELRSALDRGRRPVPSDPAFSMTSAAALAHAALLAADTGAMRRATEWATLGSFRLLQGLAAFTGVCAALLDDRERDAADLAEDVWDQTAVVPVWRVFALPVVVPALVRVGRLHASERMVAEAAELVATMEPVPNLTVSLHLARSRVALARDDLDAAELGARTALDAARARAFAPATVDALDVLTAVADRRGDARGATATREQAGAERGRLGYRFPLMLGVRAS